MKVVAINGSARKNGNTAILLTTILKELERNNIKTEMIQLFDKKINPCKACFACAEKKECSFSDDDLNAVIMKMKEADGIIIGSPTYSANVSSKIQALLERSAVIADMNPGLFSRKVGISVAVNRRAGALHTIDTINHFFLNHEMFVVGSTYWNIGYGKLSGDVNNDNEAITTMKNLGENITYLLKKIN